MSEAEYIGILDRVDDLTECLNNATCPRHRMSLAAKIDSLLDHADSYCEPDDGNDKSFMGLERINQAEQM